MENYIKTDQHIHGLCQIIAKVNNSFVQQESDDSHTNLYFDMLGDRIVGRWIETEKGKIILSLKLSDLQFEWIDATYLTMASYPSVGKMMRDVEKDIENHLPEVGLSKEQFSHNLNFEIPEYPFQMGPIPSISNHKIAEWKDVRTLANEVCSILLGHLQIDGEIRIWPHHFDTGFYVTTHNGLGVGFGLAMSDDMVDGPYFYTSGYHPSAELTYQNLPELSNGKWITSEHWNGGVLPLSALLDLPEDAHMARITDYLVQSMTWFLHQS